MTPSPLLACMAFPLAVHPFIHSSSSLYSSARPLVAVGVASVNASPDSDGSSIFVKRLETIYPRMPCPSCKGEGMVPCDRCHGIGFLTKGGYQKKNPVDLVRIIGSKWTAMESTFGWRHFIVKSKQKGAGKIWFLELVATCDESVCFWINAKNLKNREIWSMGWLQRADILNAKATSSPCKYCTGKGRILCETCNKQDDRAIIIPV